MIFRRELAERVRLGEKTVTRRLPNENPRSPWWIYGCRYKVGRDYAVCPGRGELAVCRIVIATVELMALGHLDDEEAHREGCEDRADFERVFAAVNRGVYDPKLRVWRLAFSLA